MNGRSSVAAGVTLGLALAMAPRVARAEAAKEYAPCARQPTETDIAGAKGAFQAGQASFDEADYKRSIDYWEDAYRRDCTAHALLLNLARAYELNGSKEQAVMALSTYLERVPGSPDQEKIQRRLEVLKRQLEAERAAAVTPTPAPVTPAPAPQPVTPPPSPPVPVDTGATTTTGHRPLLPLVVAGAGGAIAVIGTILYIPARSDLKDVEKICPEHQACPDASVRERGNDVRTRVNVAGAITLGGVAVLGGGLAWYFLSPRRGGAQAGAFSPVVAPSYAGMTYAGSF